MNENHSFVRSVVTGLVGLVVGGAASAQAQPIHMLDDIVISASPLAVNRLDAVVPVSTVDEESLQLRLEPSLGETLSKTPGVSSTYFGPGASRPIIRGLDRDRVRVLDNGLGIGDVSATSEDHAVGFDAITLRRVEVVRGPATLRYGSTAIGGVVNLIDSRIPEQPLGVPATGLLDARWGSGDDLRSVGGWLEGGRDALNYHVDGFYRETDDIEIPGFAESDRSFADHHEKETDAGGEAPQGEDEERARGTVPNSDTESYGGAAGLSYASEQGFVGLSATGWNSEYGVPGHAHAHGEEEGHGEDAAAHDGHDDEGEEEEGDVRIDAQTARVQLRGEVLDPVRSLQAIQFGATYSTYEHDEIEGGGEIGTMFDNDAWEGRVEFVHHPIAGWAGAAGIQVKYSDFSARGEEAFVPPSETFNVGLFLFEETPVRQDLLNLQTAARYEFQDIDADGFEGDTFHAFSASAGLLFTPVEAYAAALNLTYTERPPQSTELFADGPHVATRTFEIGDPGLDNESSLGVDLALRRRTGFVTGSLSLFYNRFANFISLTPTGDVEDGLPVFEYRDDEAEFYGGEAEALLHWINTASQHLHLDLFADYVRGRNESLDDDLPRIPPLRFLVGLEYETDGYGARIEGLFVDDQNDVAEFETTTDGYQMLNASGRVKLPVKALDLELFANGTNLTDEEARVHTSFLKDQVPLRGRSVTLGLRTRI